MTPWRDRHRLRLRAVRDGLVLVGLASALYRLVISAPFLGTVGADAFAYWRLDPEGPYRLPNGALGAFLYPPPMVHVFEPAAALPWADFWWLWTALLVGTVIWLGWRRTLIVLAFPPVALELFYGNINLLLAAAIALGFRYPAAWAFVLLTKVTPGIGLVWFAVRREWRALAIALGATAAIVGISLVIDAPLWSEWVSIIASEGDRSVEAAFPVPLVVRLPIAAALVAWGARTDRRWTVPVAATLALPVLWVAGLSVLAALAALDRPELRERTVKA